MGIAGQFRVNGKDGSDIALFAQETNDLPLSVPSAMVSKSSMHHSVLSIGKPCSMKAASKPLALSSVTEFVISGDRKAMRMCPAQADWI